MPFPSFNCMPLKYMLATRTSSARDTRSAGGVGRKNAARGWPIASRFLAPFSLCATSVSISVRRRLPSILRRTAMIIGVPASRIVEKVTIWPAV